ncbi:MAG: monofunctional biosynthetic peptidoglycan transglycosylase [Acidobacteriota bacterium]
MPPMVDVVEQPKTRKKVKPRWRVWAFRILLAVIILSVLYHGWILALVFRYKSTNPQITAMMQQRASEAESDGREPKREQTWVPYEKISSNLVRAVLAGEDQKFFDHDGFDWEELQKAVEKDWEEKKFNRGGSTISQQLSKNLFLSTSKNPLRKLHEALITAEMEQILSKRRILEIYLNVIEWGDGIYGAEAAARHYFNNSAASLNVDQAAYLSAMIPGPLNAYNPTKNPGRVNRRKALLLRLMRHVVIPRDLD